MIRGYDAWKTREPDLDEPPRMDVVCEHCGLLDEAPPEVLDLDDLTPRERDALSIGEDGDGLYHLCDGSYAGRFGEVWLQEQSYPSGPDNSDVYGDDY